MAYGDLKVNNLIYDTGSGDVTLAASAIPPAASPAFTGTITGVNLTLSGDLTVNGTTTTIDTTTLDVEDKNITLGKVSNPSDTTADGGGITLKGASDKTITWVNATNTWDFNQGIKTTDGYLEVLGAESNPATLSIYADEGDDNADKWRLQATTGGEFKIETYSTGSWVTGININSLGDVTGIGRISDSKGDLRSIPQNTQGSAYELLAADAGKHILASGNITWVDSRHAAGDAITIVNNTAGNITITKGTTMYNAADGSNANRTLATRGVCTILWVSGTVAYISGAGLS